MFDIGSSEVFLTLLVAIVVINPKDLPSLIKKTKIIIHNFSSIKKEINKTISKLEESISIQTELNEQEFEEFKKEYLEPIEKETKSIIIKNPIKSKIAKPLKTNKVKIMKKPKLKIIKEQ